MTRAVVLVAVGLVLYGNAVALAALPEWAVLVLNLVVGALVLLVARRLGLSLAEVGLSATAWRRGWRLGVAVGAAFGLVVAALAGPLGRFPADPAVQGMPVGILAWQVLVRIPIGTALFEETMFRGVLYAGWRRAADGWQAVLWSSVAFVLWHVVVELRRQERLGHGWDGDAVAAALPTFLFLFVAGVLLSLLRGRSAGVAAPAIVHATANSAAAVATYLVSN